jgi:hypothetical protein
MRSMHVRHRSSICVLNSRGDRGDGVIYGDVLLKPELGVDTCVVFSLFWFLLHGLTIDPHFRKSSTVTGTMSTAKNVCISFHQCPCNIVYLFNGACSWLEVKKKSSMNVSIPTTCTRHRMTLELYSTLCICTNPRCTTHLPCSRPRGWTIVRIPQLWVHTTPQKRR